MPRPVKGRSRPAVHTGPSPEALARLPALLTTPPESDLVSQFSAIAAETPGGALALLDALGGSRDEAAGRIVAALATSAPEKEQRKAARRALHRLRSSGVAVAMPVAGPAEPPTPAAPETLRPLLALVTAPDGIGSRLLWLLLERPRGGGQISFTLALNDVVGVKDALIDESSRRRFERQLADWRERAEREPIEIPVEYGLALLSEALALNAESHYPLPRDFVIRRSMLGELPPPPTAALIHQHVSRGQVFLLPTLLEESAGLLESEPEFVGWVFSYDEVEPFAREYRQIDESRLLLSSEPRETRLERIIGTAIDTLYTSEMRRAFRRRLEETAYVLWTSGRERAARQAVAAAFAIGDTGSLRTNPLLRQIVVRSIEMAMEIDRTGMPLPPGANRTARDPL
jgi:hypothetical protein